ncbi:hypothetical protein B296_00011236 [Ensete ventricosum]|uniref:Uncharacterized protein n=1 Tax=Ensete ventricosum TaxID=4639 RepID=A0A426ZMP6_ENSVE|nr:hypothetical protein B296_00011236 [Ensete ventricosum]
MRGNTFGRPLLFSSLPLCKSYEIYGYDWRMIGSKDNATYKRGTATYRLDTFKVGHPWPSPLYRRPSRLQGWQIMTTPLVGAAGNVRGHMWAQPHGQAASGGKAYGHSARKRLIVGRLVLARRGDTYDIALMVAARGDHQRGVAPSPA